VQTTVRKTGSLPVPLHIRNAPTRLMKDLGYGKDYKYAHNYQNAFVAQDYLPEELKGRSFYAPTGRGHEKEIKQRLDKWKNLRNRPKQDSKENETK
jgi:putative ATPase